MKKFNRRYIYYSFFTNVFIAILFSFVFTNEEIPWICAIIFGVLYVILDIYAILYYYTSSYEINEKGVTCKRGVFFKKKSFLEYSRIHAVNKKQGLIQQMFRIAYLLVDSGSSNTASSAEIMIIEDSSIVDELMEIIKNKQEHNEIDDIKEIMEDKKKEKEVNFYNFTSKTKWIYIAINTLLTLVSLVIVFLIGLIFIFAFQELIEQNDRIIPEIIFYIALSFICFTLL